MERPAVAEYIEHEHGVKRKVSAIDTIVVSVGLHELENSDVSIMDESIESMSAEDDTTSSEFCIGPRRPEELGEDWKKKSWTFRKKRMKLL